ncbi:phage head closure protein [Lactobacillus johnsonii]|uniref:phage head closure protein n=1 Tax=Lactobacillus johnsonii TaxID=33959 RepID=UPI00201A7CD1|nr:phage head closure protein [Lactobacillus johnsonii]
MTKHTSINIARMRYRLEFGVMGPTDEINPNTGETVNGFVPQFTKWAGQWNLSQTQEATFAGSNQGDLMTFFVRHDKNITSDMILRLDGKEYTITHINRDDGLTSNSFDLITCKRKEVHHA